MTCHHGILIYDFCPACALIKFEAIHGTNDEILDVSLLGECWSLLWGSRWQLEYADADTN